MHKRIICLLLLLPMANLIGVHNYELSNELNTLKEFYANFIIHGVAHLMEQH